MRERARASQLSGRLTAAMVVVILALALGLMAWAASQDSATSDEIPHIGAAYSYVTQHDLRLNREHPPLFKLLSGAAMVAFGDAHMPNSEAWAAADEWTFGGDFLYHTPGNNPERIIMAARWPMMLLMIATAAVVALWAFELFGGWAAVTAAALFALDPTMLEHGHLVTNDLPAAGLGVMSLYAYWKYYRSGFLSWLVLAGVLLGLAMGTKVTAVLLAVVILAVSAAAFFWKRGDWRELLRGGGVVMIGLVVSGLCYALVLGPNWHEIVSAMQDAWRFGREVSAMTTRDAFLLGQHYTGGQPQYFPLAFLIKTPLVTLAVLLLAVATITKKKLLQNRRAELLLLLAMLIPTAVALDSHLNIGLRHLFMAYPALYIWMSRAANTFRRPVVPAIAVGGMLVVQVLTAPLYLPYANAAAGGSANTHNLLVDSNTEWGQDMKRIGRYAKDHNITNMKVCLYVDTGTQLYDLSNYCDLAHPELVHGFWAVSPTYLAYQGYARDGWSIHGFKPVGLIGNATLLYQIP